MRTASLEATLQEGKDPMDVQWMFIILEKWCCSLNSGSARVTEVPRALCEGAGGCWRLVNSCTNHYVDKLTMLTMITMMIMLMCVREQEDAGGWSTLI